MDALLSWPLHHLFAAVIGLFALLTVHQWFFTVEQQTVKIIQRFGRFHRVAHTGPNVKFPWIDTIVDEVSLQVQELKIEVVTKTLDNVIVMLHICVQFKVRPGSEKDAYYLLQDEREQITSYVRNEVVSEVPTLNLDQVYAEKKKIQDEVLAKLTETMSNFGFEIVAVLVADIQPDAKVAESMNEINAAQRYRDAANARGEGEKTLAIKKAEGQAESKRLQGEGIAMERRAIAKGIKDSVELLEETGASPSDAMETLVLTQYFDTLRDIGASDRSHTVFLDHSPAGVGDIRRQIIAGREVKSETGSNGTSAPRSPEPEAEHASDAEAAA